MRVLILLSFIFIACTHSPQGPVSSDCSWDSLPDEAGWVFLKCRLKNESSGKLSIALAPEIRDSTVSEPTLEELKNLQERLKKRTLSPPLYIGGGNSGRPELFVMQALAGLSMVLLQYNAKLDPVSDQHQLDLEKGETRTLLFPLKGSRQNAPLRIELQFQKPFEEKRSITIEKDPADIRRRPAEG